jgi:hypothetical protein
VYEIYAEDRNGSKNRLFADLTSIFPNIRTGVVNINLEKAFPKDTRGFGMLAIVNSLAVPEVNKIQCI